MQSSVYGGIWMLVHPNINVGPAASPASYVRTTSGESFSPYLYIVILSRGAVYRPYNGSCWGIF